MARTSARSAFGLSDLVVVVAVGGLMVSVLVPGSTDLGRKRRAASCLSNLRQIAAASWQYAGEDAREQLVPLHQTMIRTFHSLGFPNPQWSWRTAMPRAFGGRTATVPFPTDGGLVTVLMEQDGYWATRTRPLNHCLYPSLAERCALRRTVGLTVFHCPADVGYPDSSWIHDAPLQAAGIPHYDMLGNSYRYPTLGMVWTGMGGAPGASSGPRSGDTRPHLLRVLSPRRFCMRILCF
jgi:hypothetical protein